MTRMSFGKLIIIGSDNGFSPDSWKQISMKFQIPIHQTHNSTRSRGWYAVALGCLYFDVVSAFCSTTGSGQNKENIKRFFC